VWNHPTTPENIGPVKWTCSERHMNVRDGSKRSFMPVLGLELLWFV
jgi:hypothetical protein